MNTGKYCLKGNMQRKVCASILNTKIPEMAIKVSIDLEGQ